jgi:voltage-gated potassium channel
MDPAKASTAKHSRQKASLRRLVYHMLGGEGHQDFWVRFVDYFLIGLIILNIISVVLESVATLSIAHGPIFHAFDLISVAIFSLEYVLRVWTCVESDNPAFHHPLFGRLRYMATPLAIIDLLAVLPFYLGMFVEIDLRAMRVLRLLRVFKLTRYSSAMTMLIAVIKQESRAVGAILFIMAVLIVFSASVMYLFEHPVQPAAFPDIPAAMWWSVVTLTTLGYGDITPITPWGRLFGGLVAIMGVGMVALPSGILATGFAEQLRQRRAEYRERVVEALSVGRLSKAERHALEEMREQLGMNEEEAAAILEHVVSHDHSTTCPHCGKMLEGYVPPRPKHAHKHAHKPAPPPDEGSR